MRPEFRDYAPTAKQMRQWLASMAFLYDALHEGDPEWFHSMSEEKLPPELASLPPEPVTAGMRAWKGER